MAKQSNQKLKLLYLLRILLEQTDEQSGLTLMQISSELAKYNVSAERKSLYDDIESLRLFGIDVSVKRDRYVRYYIAKREISYAELKYIVDALNAFDALSPSASYELASKFTRIYGGKGNIYSGCLEEPVYKTPAVVSDEFAKSIDLLEKAILRSKKVRFKIFEWNSLKQRTVLNGGKSVYVTPISLVCDEKYLLYAYDGNGIVTYDVDSLIELEISDEDSAPKENYQKLLEESACGADYENVRLEFGASFAGDVFRKFGLGVTVLSSRGERFEISLKVKLDNDFYAWLFNNAKYVRVISPERVINDYKDKLLLALDNIKI